MAMRIRALYLIVVAGLVACASDPSSNISDLGGGRYMASWGTPNGAINAGRYFCQSRSLGQFVAETFIPSNGLTYDTVTFKCVR